MHSDGHFEYNQIFIHSRMSDASDNSHLLGHNIYIYQITSEIFIYIKIRTWCFTQNFPKGMF